MRVILGFCLGCIVWNAMERRDVVETVHGVMVAAEVTVDRMVEAVQR
jgi:hypothetical protein